MRPSPLRPVVATLAVTITGLVAASCTGGASDTTVAVTGTNGACRIETVKVPAGKIAFEFTNTADDVNELYVLKGDGDVVGEVENVTTGTTRTLIADLPAGDYKVRCKPGQTGTGVTSRFAVTGSGGTAQAAPDRVVAFDAVDFSYQDLDLSGIATGDTIRFEMTNGGTQPHEFEVLGPDGEPVGEVAGVEPGSSGGATITFTESGGYAYQCILVDPASTQEHADMGMKGTFTVAAG